MMLTLMSFRLLVPGLVSKVIVQCHDQGSQLLCQVDALHRHAGQLTKLDRDLQAVCSFTCRMQLLNVCSACGSYRQAVDRPYHDKTAFEAVTLPHDQRIHVTDLAGGHAWLP